MRRAVFLDRDGTLNVERGFVRSPDELCLLPDVVTPLRRLHEAGFLLIVVTNQSGIARGLYTEHDLARIHAKLHASLEQLPDAYLHCPHHPDVEPHPYRRACPCRKPAGGLVAQAARLFDLDLGASHVVGDSARDLLMTYDAPVHRVLVRSGKPWEAELERLDQAGLTPDVVCDDLAAAAEAILS